MTKTKTRRPPSSPQHEHPTSYTTSWDLTPLMAASRNSRTSNAEPPALDIRREPPDRRANRLGAIDVKAVVRIAVSHASSLDELKARRAMNGRSNLLALDQRQIRELDVPIGHRVGS